MIKKSSKPFFAGPWSIWDVKPICLLYSGQNQLRGSGTRPAFKMKHSGGVMSQSQSQLSGGWSKGIAPSRSARPCLKNTNWRTSFTNRWSRLLHCMSFRATSRLILRAAEREPTFHYVWHRWAPLEMRWFCRSSACHQSRTTWVQVLGPIWWKGRPDSRTLTSNLDMREHLSIYVCMHTRTYTHM